MTAAPPGQASGVAVQVGSLAGLSSLWRYNEKYHPYWRPRYVAINALEYSAAAAVAIVDAEAIWELPLIGRFLGHR